MNFRPVVIPQIQLHRVHLLHKLCIILDLKRGKHQLGRALNNGLTLTQQRKHTIMALISPKLFRSRYNNKILAVSHKNSTLTRRYIYLAVIRIVNIDISSHIKDKVLRVVAVLDVVLLALYRVDLFDPELALLVLEAVVVGVVFLFYCLWFENVWIARFLLWFWWLGDLLLCNLDWNLLWSVVKTWLTRT